MNEQIIDRIEPIVSGIIDSMGSGDFDSAKLAALRAQQMHPRESRLTYLRALCESATGNTREAIDLAWKTIALSPDTEAGRELLLSHYIELKCPPTPCIKDFSLNSGERQTSTKLESIRADHLVRYELAAQWIMQNFSSPWRLTGVDAFCGNGYGSNLVATRTGARLIGIDGSEDAINLADAHYRTEKIVYGAAQFPFGFSRASFDFAICFESIEHVEHSEDLFETICESTDGPIFLSIPNEDGLPYKIFRTAFEHHFRHFTTDEVVKLTARAGKKIEAHLGQNTYVLRNNKIVGLLPEHKMTLHTPRQDDHFSIYVIR